MARTAAQWTQIQEKADDLYGKAQNRFEVYGPENKKAQLMELESSRLQAKVNAAIDRGEC